MDDAGCVVYLFLGALAIFLLYLFIVYVVIPIATYVIFPATVITAGVGVGIGGGAAIRNYFRAYLKAARDK